MQISQKSIKTPPFRRSHARLRSKDFVILIRSGGVKKGHKKTRSNLGKKKQFQTAETVERQGTETSREFSSVNMFLQKASSAGSVSRLLCRGRSGIMKNGLKRKTNKEYLAKKIRNKEFYGFG